jgi:hypothetical protein
MTDVCVGFFLLMFVAPAVMKAVTKFEKKNRSGKLR